MTVEGPLLFSIYVVVVTPFSPQKKRDESSVRTQPCRFSPNGACGKMFLSDSKYVSQYLSVLKKIKILCFYFRTLDITLIALVSNVTLLEWLLNFAQCWLPCARLNPVARIPWAPSTAQILKVTLIEWHLKLTLLAWYQVFTPIVLENLGIWIIFLQKIFFLAKLRINHVSSIYLLRNLE